MRENKDLEALLSDPRKAMIHMAVPLVLTYLIVNLQTFIDRIWCSGLGPDALSAISISAPVYRIIVALGIAIGVGASATIAHEIGAGNRDKACRLSSQSIVLAIIVSLLAMPVMFYASTPIIAVSGDGYNIDLSMDYTIPFIICALPLILNGLLTGLFRGEGAARKSMILSISASIINMILDPIMIYGLDMGIVGASWATCISFIVSTVFGWLWYRFGESYIVPAFKSFRFERALLKEMAIFSIPLALESILAALIIAPEQGLVASCGGAEGLVVYVNSFSFIDLVLIPAMALSSALIPVVSAQMGQGCPEKVVESFRYSSKLILLLGAFFGVLLFIFADQLMELYTYSDSMKGLHDEMVFALRIYCIVPILNGFIRLGTSLLQAMRKAVFSTVLMFTRELVFLTFFWFASKISMEAIYWSVDLTNIIMVAVVLGVALIVLNNYIRANGTYRVDDAKTQG